MLQTLEEVKNTRGEAKVINGVDDPNLMSVDSTAAIETDADETETKEPEQEKEKKPSTSKEEEVEETEEEKEVAEEETEKPPQKKEGTKTKDKVQERIDELTKKRRVAEREKEFIARKLAAAEEELAKLKAKEPPKDKPKRADFEDDDEYIEALTEWKVEQKLGDQQVKAEKAVKEKTEKSAMQQFEEAVDEIVETGKEKYEDFMEVSTKMPLDEKMMEAIVHSESDELAADIIYYLGKNPEEAAEIQEMSPLKAARAIERIAIKVSKEEDGSPSEKKPVVKKQLTKAEEPIKPQKSTGGIDKDPNNMSPAEYRAWREKRKG